VHGIDVETAGYEGGGALETDEGRLRLVQISDGKVTDIHDAFLDDHDEIRRAIEEREELVAHNAKFERKWLKHALGIDRADLHDTMIMSQVLTTGTRADLNRDSGHSLEMVAKRLLRVDVDKTMQTSNWGDEELSKEQLEYAAKDAAIMPALADALLRRIDRTGLRKVYELERRLSHAVDAMERRGVAIHADRLDEMTEEATERAERLKAELAEEWGINPGSSKQLREHFELVNRKDWPTTPSGAPSTNQEAMKGLLAEEESVAKWLEWKEVEKIRSTYGESLRKRLTPEGRIHARFNPFGTATGRFSSSGPNLQNIPKRGAFGKRMRGLFWSGSDNRVLIKANSTPRSSCGSRRCCGADPHMQRALQQGVNMHVATAAALFNASSRGRRSLRSKIRRRITSVLPA